MATPPVFSVGAVLTAAQMNAIGVWKVTPTSVAGTGVTTSASGSVVVASGGTAINVNGVFTADFDNYDIMITNARSSSAINVQFKLRDAGGDISTNYYFGNADGGAYGAAQTFILSNMITSSTDTAGGKFSIYNPFIAEETTLLFDGTDSRSAGNSRQRQAGVQISNTSMTGFSILTGSPATFTAMKISIFGYRG